MADNPTPTGEPENSESFTWRVLWIGQGSVDVFDSIEEAEEWRARWPQCDADIQYRRDVTTSYPWASVAANFDSEGGM